VIREGELEQFPGTGWQLHLHRLGIEPVVSQLSGQKDTRSHDLHRQHAARTTAVRARTTRRGANRRGSAAEAVGTLRARPRVQPAAGRHIPAVVDRDDVYQRDQVA
jgi:hypothetical protein